MIRFAFCGTQHEYTKYIILKVVVNLDNYIWPDTSAAFFAQAAKVVTDDGELRARLRCEQRDVRPFAEPSVCYAVG